MTTSGKSTSNSAVFVLKTAIRKYNQQHKMLLRAIKLKSDANISSVLQKIPRIHLEMSQKVLCLENTSFHAKAQSLKLLHCIPEAEYTLVMDKLQSLKSGTNAKLRDLASSAIEFYTGYQTYWSLLRNSTVVPDASDSTIQIIMQNSHLQSLFANFTYYDRNLAEIAADLQILIPSDNLDLNVQNLWQMVVDASSTSDVMSWSDWHDTVQNLNGKMDHGLVFNVISFLHNTAMSYRQAVRHKNTNDITTKSLKAYLQVLMMYSEIVSKIQDQLSRYFMTWNVSQVVKSIADAVFYIDLILGKKSSEGVKKNNKHQDWFLVAAQDLRDVTADNFHEMMSFLHHIQRIMEIAKILKLGTDFKPYQKVMNDHINCVNTAELLTQKMHAKICHNLNLIDAGELHAAQYQTSQDLDEIWQLFKIINANYCRVCYQKYLQSRLVTRRYNLAQFTYEMWVLSQFKSKCHNDVQNLEGMIQDVIQSSSIGHALSTVIVTGAETEIDVSVLQPLIIHQGEWKIFSSWPDDLDLRLPAPLEMCQKIMTRYLDTAYQQEFAVEWHPFLGSAQFHFDCHHQTIELTCNMLQAILLCYINTHNEFDTDEFACEVNLHPDLAHHVVLSVFDANLITLNSEGLAYVVNWNYSGDTQLDLTTRFGLVVE